MKLGREALGRIESKKIGDTEIKREDGVEEMRIQTGSNKYILTKEINSLH